MIPLLEPRASRRAGCPAGAAGAPSGTLERGAERAGLFGQFGPFGRFGRASLSVFIRTICTQKFYR
jgi:hypothetical protein